MKTNTITAGIAMTMLLLALALPAAASDYTLGVFGNANEDDTINMQDVTYTELIILEYRDETELSDAKHDNKINMQDVTQIELVILGKEKEITLIDSFDRTVTVKKPVERLVVCFPHTLEALRSLKVPKDPIIGIAQDHIDTEFFPEFSDVPSVGFRYTLDIEAILNLHPDAVIMGVFRFSESTASVLESAGITVLVFKCNDPDIHQEELKKLGYVFGKHDEAEEYLDWRENILNSIKEVVESVPEEDKPEVYFETASEFGQYSTHRYCEDFIKACGGTNIFEGMSAKIDAEAVIDRDPDIIVKSPPYAACDYDPGGYHLDVCDTIEIRESWEDVMGRPELSKVKAVEDEEVYIITVHLLNFYWSSGCRDFIGYAYMAKWFHPDLFEDLDPQAIHQEYLTEFQGLDIDLDEKGVFVYPPLETS